MIYIYIYHTSYIYIYESYIYIEAALFPGAFFGPLWPAELQEVPLAVKPARGRAGR